MLFFTKVKKKIVKMKCSQCGMEMGKVSVDKSYNLDVPEKTEYTRTRYNCKHDDVWVTVEIPVKK